jgi:hypothetical protein
LMSLSGKVSFDGASIFIFTVFSIFLKMVFIYWQTNLLHNFSKSTETQNCCVFYKFTFT